MHQKMVDLLKKHEGFRSHIYEDTKGNLTIGYGTMISDGIDKYEAEAMMLARLRVLRERCTHIPGWINMDPDRQAVLLHMAYNMGFKGLLSFKRMLIAVKNGDYRLAAKEMLDSVWAKQVGKRAEELAAIMRGMYG